MTPDEVLRELKDKGFDISRRTLLRYEEQELIPKPERTALGRGRGRLTEYPVDTVAEALAACHMMKHGYEKREISEARSEILRLLKTFFIDDIHDYIGDMEEDELSKTLFITSPLTRSEFDWVTTWARYKNEIDFNQQVYIIVTGKLDSNEQEVNILKRQDVPSFYLTGISQVFQNEASTRSFKDGSVVIFKAIGINNIFRYISPEDMKVYTTKRNI